MIDSGNGRKLERFGKYLLIRPEAEAIWKPALPETEWQSAHASFHSTSETHGGHWDHLKKIPESWNMNYKDIKFLVQTTASRHIGVFPEQSTHWDWIENQTARIDKPIKVLNLFGYTGLATLSAAKAGAHVTHIDASRKAVNWARENQALSGLAELPIRWLVDDALKFVQKEGRRNSTYQGIILDPPKFGRGPKGEVWEFYKLLPRLLQACKNILSNQPRFIVLTAYAVKASSLTMYHALDELMQGWPGSTTAGEIILAEKSAGRSLSTSIFARWSSD